MSRWGKKQRQDEQPEPDEHVDHDTAPGCEAIDAACAAVHPLLVTDPSRVPPTD
ncbi:hypothetical protein ACWDHH_13285 [Janibacter hoylei]|uniref:hypothetical protein n=1 Tax=Janibacter hoylei TaxID=364298 RepID=UPI0022370985|nr:hypothetical protein [Janibacter hoylei]MCW4601638.1 hypothetical protein [Janibacter hoylei]